MNTLEEEYNSQEQKMKRMSIAVKGIAGWFSYFIGCAVLIVGTLNIYMQFKQLDYFITFLGLPILIGGFYLLYSHIKLKNFLGKVKIVKLVKTFGGLFILPGLLGLTTFGYESIYSKNFLTSASIGLALIIISIFLKKAWGIKTEKRKRKIEAV